MHPGLRTVGITALAFTLCSTLSAQDFLGYGPTSGVPGDKITIVGTGFPTDGKPPKFQLVGDRKVKLKVTLIDETMMTATLPKRGKAGSYTLEFKPKGKGNDPLQIKPSPDADAAGAFTIEGPVITLVENTDGTSGASAEAFEIVRVEGEFFGPKKGKIRVGNKNAKVVKDSWIDDPEGPDSAEFQLPKNPKALADGTYDVDLTNTVGMGTAHLGLTITGSTATKVGRSSVKAEIDQKKKFKAKAVVELTDGGETTLTITGTKGKGAKATTLAITIAGFDPEELGLQTFALQPSGIVFDTKDGEFTTDGGAFMLAINSSAGDQRGGQFCGTLFDGGSHHVLEGEFVIELPTP